MPLNTREISTPPIAGCGGSAAPPRAPPDDRRRFTAAVISAIKRPRWRRGRGSAGADGADPLRAGDPDRRGCLRVLQYAGLGALVDFSAAVSLLLPAGDRPPRDPSAVWVSRRGVCASGRCLQGD